MKKFQQSDLRSIDNDQSLIRKVLREGGNISLQDLPCFFDYSGYKRKFHYFEDEDFNNSLKKYLTLIEESGISDSFKFGFLEAVRNAYEYGNHKQSDLPILIGYKFGKDHLDLLIEDSGKTPFDLDVLHYTQYLRDLDFSKGNIRSFYDRVTDRDKPKNHSGVGFLTMHMGSDEVELAKSGLGGLLVKLRKYI